MRRFIRREPAPARPPEPAGTASAECFKGSVSIEHFDAETRHGIDIKERLIL
jgi:hypothetical protein